MTQKENPPEIDSLPAVSEGFESEAETLPKKITRYSRARERAVNIISHVEAKQQVTGSPFFAKVAKGLTGCGNYLHFRDYYTVGKLRLHSASFCKKHLFCPLCAVRRASKTMQAYMPKYQLIMAEKPNLAPYMVTLTVKNGDDLLERYNHLVKSLQKLTRARTRSLSGSRDKTQFSKIHAAVGSYEFTNRGKGWHPHVHMVVLSETPIDQWLLSAEWKRATGDSFIVDVRPIGNADNPVKGFAEVFKYALKFSDLTPDQHVHAATVLNAKRMLFSLGAFRGVVVPESLLDSPLDGLPFHDLFYDYIHGSGYNFRP
jgi:hypothetical protein